MSVDDDPGATSEEVQDFWERAGETLEDHPNQWSTISSLDPINDIDTANSGLQTIEQSIGDDEIIGPTQPELPLLSSSNSKVSPKVSSENSLGETAEKVHSTIEASCSIGLFMAAGFLGIIAIASGGIAAPVAALGIAMIVAPEALAGFSLWMIIKNIWRKK